MDGKAIFKRIKGYDYLGKNLERIIQVDGIDDLDLGFPDIGETGLDEGNSNTAPFLLETNAMLERESALQKLEPNDFEGRHFVAICGLCDSKMHPEMVDSHLRTEHPQNSISKVYEVQIVPHDGLLCMWWSDFCTASEDCQRYS